MKLRRPLIGPDTQGGPSHGSDVVAVKRGLSKVEDDFFPRPASGFSNVYNRKTVDAVKVFQKLNGIKATGQLGQKTLDALEPYMDARAKALYERFEVPLEPSRVPDLGPVVAGGQTILEHDLTHATGGISLYPAFDDAFVQGREIIAPEDIEVTVNPRTGAHFSSASPGEAFYAKGASGFRYWFGHLDRNHPPGTRFMKGTFVGRVAPNSVGGGPHVHVGVNVEDLLGVGKELTHHTNYTHGAVPVGEQLKKALA